MIRVQLLADSEFFSSYATMLRGFDGIELVGQNPDVLFDAMFLSPSQKLSSLSHLDRSAPLIITNTLTMTATTAKAALGEEVDVIGMPMFPNYFSRQKAVEYSVPYGSDPATEQMNELLQTMGKSTEKVRDGVAGVFPRTLVLIINEAAFTVEEGVASAADIDNAMKLGTRYPSGPLEWCDEIGPKAIVAVLDALAREYDPMRYRVAPLLRRYAEANLNFTATSTIAGEVS